MNIEECYYLGYVSKIIGNKGELAFKLDVDSPSFYENIDAVFIRPHPNDQVLVPYFIRNSKLQNNELLRVEIEDINNQDTARELVGKELYLPLQALPPLEGNKFYFHEVIGFKVVDVKHGELGTIKEVLDFPAGALFEVVSESKEFLIPINNESIILVDRDNKIIQVATAEGLVELYLNN